MKKLLPALAVLAASAPALADDQLSFTTGFDYSTGKYGNATATEILYIPVTAKYETDKLTYKLTVPYISVTGPGGVIQGFGKVPNATAPGTGPGRFGRSTTGGVTTNSGLGDVVGSVGYNFYAGDALSLDAVGKVKLGTADVNKGLGTGQNDYSAQIDGYYTFTAQSTFMFTGGYKMIGAPAGIQTNNVPYGMLGLDQKTSNVSNVGVMFSIEKSVSPTIPDQKDVTLYIMQKLSSGLKLQASLLKGFTNASPDYGGGLMITGVF